MINFVSAKRNNHLFLYFCPHSLMDRISDSGSDGRGSNPLGGTKPKRSDSASQSAFFDYDTCYLHHLSSQSKYSLCQNSAFCGLRIQWHSSGKTISLDGTPIICAALNAAMPWS